MSNQNPRIVTRTASELRIGDVIDLRPSIEEWQKARSYRSNLVDEKGLQLLLADPVQRLRERTWIGADEVKLAFEAHNEPWHGLVDDTFLVTLDTGSPEYGTIGEYTDDLTCVCGNDSSQDGFIPATDGLPSTFAVDNARDHNWDHKTYMCPSCGRTYDESNATPKSMLLATGRADVVAIEAEIMKYYDEN